MTALDILHWGAGLIVVAEALNKLERVTPCARGMTPHARLVDSLKALAWALLAVGGGGALVKPFLSSDPASLAEVCVLTGFAVLIVRTRVKEG